MKLARLKEAGVIADEEFTVKKTAILGLNQPPSQGTGKNLNLLMLAGLLILALVAVGYFMDTSSLPGRSKQSGPVTKAAWLAKFTERYGAYARAGVIYQIKIADFKKTMGEPTKTQTIGDNAYWYYVCTDGTVQLELMADYVRMGVLNGKINDF